MVINVKAMRPTIRITLPSASQNSDSKAVMFRYLYEQNIKEVPTSIIRYSKYTQESKARPSEM